MERKVIEIQVPGFSFRWDRPAKEAMKPEYKLYMFLALVGAAAFVGFFAMLIFG